MKNLFVFIIVLLFFLQNMMYGESIDKRVFEKLTASVLDLINEKNIKKIKLFLAKDIKLENIRSDEIKRLSDKLLDDEISVEDYLKKITGNNLYLFVKNYKIVSHKIILIDKESKYGGSGLYFIKLKIDYMFKGKVFKHVDLELDFKKENNKFKLVGFII